jgi:HK97 family phage major capsid protein
MTALPPLRLSRLLQTQVTGALTDGAVEHAAHIEVRRELEANGQWPASFHGGLMLPFDAPLEPTRARAGIDTLSTGAEFSNWTQSLGFFGLLRSKMGALRYATRVPVTHNNARLVRQLTTGGATWVAENPGSDTPPSNPTFSAVTVALKTLIASTSYSRQSIFAAASGDNSLEQLIRDDLAQMIGIALELAAVQGLGASNQPLGLLSNTSVGSYAMGTNGGVFSLAAAAAMEYTAASSNADRGSLAWHTTPAVRRKARTTEGFAGNGPIWRDDNIVIGYPAFASTNVPENLSKGTSTSVCSAAIFGAWQDLVIATWAPAVEFVVDPYSKKNQQMVEVAARLYCDVVVANPASFVVTKDLLTV